MRKLIAILAVVSLLAGIGAVAAFATTKGVTWKKPTSVTVRIHKNDTVKWVWGDSKPHNLKGPGLNTTVFSGKGHVVKKKFTKTGKFTYICIVHPTSMKTIVKVG